MARVESKTYICTKDKRESIPQAKEGVKGQLGNWMGESTIKKELDKRFPGCMKGTSDDIFRTYFSLSNQWFYVGEGKFKSRKVKIFVMSSKPRKVLCFDWLTGRAC